MHCRNYGKNNVPNKALVKYHHLFPGFKEDPLFGFRFNRISPEFVYVSNFGVCPDFLEPRRDPIFVTYDPNNINVDEEGCHQINRVGVL
jgi:hypothetical protein